MVNSKSSNCKYKDEFLINFRTNSPSDAVCSLAQP